MKALFILILLGAASWWLNRYLNPVAPEPPPETVAVVPDTPPPTPVPTPAPRLYKSSQCYLVRGIVIAKAPQGLVIQIAPPLVRPKVEEARHATSMDNPRAAKTDLNDLLTRQTQADADFERAKLEYGETFQRIGPKVVVADAEPGLFAQGQVLLVDHPYQRDITVGAKLQVITAPLNQGFKYQTHLIPAYTMHIVVAPVETKKPSSARDWMFDPNHGALAPASKP
jgi:hypothetical protein